MPQALGVSCFCIQPYRAGEAPIGKGRETIRSRSVFGDSQIQLKLSTPLTNILRSGKFDGINHQPAHDEKKISKAQETILANLKELTENASDSAFLIR